jgi:hypothetical protein
VQVPLQQQRQLGRLLQLQQQEQQEQVPVAELAAQ